MEETTNRTNYGLICYLIATLVFLADQLTKTLIEQFLRLGDSIPVIETVDFFRITYITNTGAAWGLFKGYYVLFIGAALVVSVACIWVIQTAPEPRIRLTAALILGGGIGNMIDRVFLSTGVVDFLDVGIYSYRWPAFNIADMMLVIGVVVFVVFVALNEGIFEDVDFPSGILKTSNG